MRARQHSFALVAAAITCIPETSLAFTNNGPCTGNGLAFRRNGLELSVENGGREETEPAGNLDSQKCEGRKHDMSDRFKYKVNALLGTYDPQNRADDERQDGNILEGESQGCMLRTVACRTFYSDTNHFLVL